jgi:hypothetical protein
MMLSRYRYRVTAPLRAVVDQTERLGFAALALVCAAVAIPLLSGVAPSLRVHGLEVLALLGLLTGGTLLLSASRRYALGLGGALTCGLVAILLATYAGLVLNASSSIEDRGLPTLHAERPAVFLAMLGLMAALLLLPSPWSIRRARLQPVLVGAGVGLPTAALLMLPSGLVSPATVASRLTGYSNPLLVLGLMGVALLVPVQIAGSVSWVQLWMQGATRATRSLATPKPWLIGLAVWTTWLVLGALGALPHDAGRDLDVWTPLRHTDARTWLIAGALTLAAALFSARTKGILEQAEGASAAIVGLVYIFGPVGLAFALLLMLLCAVLTFQAESAAALGAVATLAIAFVAASPIAWFAGTKRGRPLLLGVGAVGVVALVSFATLLWPTAAGSFVQVSLFGGGRGIGTFSATTNANGVVLSVLVICPLMAMTLAASYALAMRRLFDFREPWRGTAEYGYALTVAPACVWMLAGAALVVPGAIAHPLTNAFADWPLPDPSVFVVIACCALTVVGAVRWARREHALLNERHLAGVTALSAMAFVPFLVPAAFRSGGHLALAGVTIVLLGTLLVVAARQQPSEARRRSISWLLGAAAFSVPLLAYTSVAAGYSPVLAGGVLADVGHNVSPSPFAHLRLLVVVPLTVALMVADHELPWSRGRAVRDSRWQDFEADSLVEAVRGGYLSDLLDPPLRRYFTRLGPEAGRHVALHLARALGRGYRARRSLPASAQASRRDVEAALAIAERAARGDADGHEISQTLATAARLDAAAESAKGAARQVRRQLAVTLRVVAGASDASVDELTTAAVVAVRATIRPYLVPKHASDEQRDRAVIGCRHALGDLIDAWPERFTVFDDPSVLTETLALTVTPAFVLADERERLGLTQTTARPYLYVAVILALIAATALTMYFALVVELKVVPHLFH